MLLTADQLRDVGTVATLMESDAGKAWADGLLASVRG
jgi:hypothetical protein